MERGPDLTFEVEPKAESSKSQEILQIGDKYEFTFRRGLRIVAAYFLFGMFTSVAASFLVKSKPKKLSVDSTLCFCATQSGF